MQCFDHEISVGPIKTTWFGQQRTFSVIEIANAFFSFVISVHELLLRSSQKLFFTTMREGLLIFMFFFIHMQKIIAIEAKIIPHKRHNIYELCGHDHRNRLTT